jgi:drug/metabolite transporter (DMT)-like permease
MPRVFRRTLGVSVLVSLLWGSNFVAQKVGLRYAEPILLSAIRQWGGGLLLVVVALLTGRRSFPRREELPALAWLGLLMGLTGGFLYLGLARLGAGLASILLYTFPLITALEAAVVLHERLDRRAIAGIAVGFAGVGLLAGRLGDATGLGMVFIVAAAASWATTSVLYKAMAADPAAARRDALLFTAWSLLGGAVTQSALSLAVEGLPRLEPTTGLLWSYLYMTVPGLAVTWALWYALLRWGEASRASAMLFMTPVFGVFFGWWLLGETVTVVQLVGGALVAAAIVLVAPSSQPAPAETPSPATATDRSAPARAP